MRFAKCFLPLLVTFLFIFSNTFSQKRAKERLPLSWSAELTLSTPTVKMNEINARFGHRIHDVAWLPGYGVGIRGEKEKGIGISFGINYRPLRFQIDYNFSPIEPIEGIAERSEFRQTLLGFQYEHHIRIFRRKRLTMGSSMGTEVTIFARREDRTVFGEGEVELNTLFQPFNTVNLNFIGGLDLAYSFHDRVGVRLYGGLHFYPIDMAWDAFVDYQAVVPTGEMSFYFLL